MKSHIMIGLMATGLIAGCSTSKVQYSDLPAPVQNTLRNQCHNAQIAKIEKEKHHGCPVYEVEFCAPGKNPKVHINPDGTIVD